MAGACYTQSLPAPSQTAFSKAKPPRTLRRGMALAWADLALTVGRCGPKHASSTHAPPKKSRGFNTFNCRCQICLSDTSIIDHQQPPVNLIRNYFFADPGTQFSEPPEQHQQPKQPTPERLVPRFLHLCVLLRRPETACQADVSDRRCAQRQFRFQSFLPLHHIFKRIGAEE